MHRLARRTFLGGLGAGAALAGIGVPGLRALAQRDPSSAIQAILDRFVAHSRALGHEDAGVVAGAIGPGLPDNALFFGGRLVAAHDRSLPVPLDGDTPFLIGSITKTFCSWVFANNGGDYRAPLGEYVRIPLPAGVAGMPVTDIANYSSGFPTDDVEPIWWSGLHPDDLGSLSNALAGKSLPQCLPGTSYSYSNFSWGLLGLAAVGVPAFGTDALGEWKTAIGQLRAHLGLSAVTAPFDASAPPAGLAAGYTRAGRLLPPGFRYGGRYPQTMFGAGDLVSSGNDMHAWLRYNMGRMVSADTDLLHRQQSPDFPWQTQTPPARNGTSYCPAARRLREPVHTALGWFRSNRFADPRVTVLSKNGGVAGYTSWMGFQSWVENAEQSPVGAFALTNGIRPGADGIGRAILNALLR
jgi:beta-lactamase class C